MAGRKRRALSGIWSDDDTIHIGSSTLLQVSWNGALLDETEGDILIEEDRGDKLDETREDTNLLSEPETGGDNLVTEDVLEEADGLEEEDELEEEDRLEVEVEDGPEE